MRTNLYYYRLQRLVIGLIIFFVSGSAYAQRSFWPTDNARFDSLSMLMQEVYHNKNQEQLNEIITSMYAIAEETGDKTLLSYATYWQARYLLSQDSDSADTLINNGMASLDSLSNPYAYNRFVILKASFMDSRNDYVDAYRAYEGAIPYFETIGDTVTLADIYVNEGNLMNKLGNEDDALALYQQANEYYKRKGFNTTAIKNSLNIYNIRFAQGEGESAYKELEQIIENPIVRQDTLFVINVMLTLCANALDDSTYFKYAQRTYELANLINHPKLLNKTRINKTNMHFKKNELDSALYYSRMIYDYSKDNNNPDELINASFLLFLYHEQQLQPDSALFYMKEYQLHHASIYSMEKILAVNKIRAQAEINNYQEQLRFAAEKAAFEKRRTWLTALLVLSLAILVCVILWFRWRKVKTEKRIKELENRELNSQLDYKNRELTTHTLMLNEKNHTLREIKREIENLDLNGHISQQDKKQLEERIDKQLKSDDEWEYVKQHFESVHPGFFTGLKAIAPALSENDLRLCVYIHMGISSKEMARLLSIRHGSINQGRYRIRQELGLDGDTVLEDFLRSI